MKDKLFYNSAIEDRLYLKLNLVYKSILPLELSLQSFIQIYLENS